MLNLRMKVARVRCLSPKEPAEVQATDPCRDPRGVRTAAGRLQVVAGPWRLQRAGAFARAMRTSPGMRKGSSWATRIGTGERAPRHTRHLQDTASIEQGRWPGASPTLRAPASGGDLPPSAVIWGQQGYNQMRRRLRKAATVREGRFWNSHRFSRWIAHRRKTSSRAAPLRHAFTRAGSGRRPRDREPRTRHGRLCRT
jgi:hypothetical protein